MEILKDKKIKILVIALGTLLIVFLLLSLINNIKPNENKDDHSYEDPENPAIYKEVTDDANTILGKIYNKNYNYNVGIRTKEGEVQNIFGNKEETSSTSLNIETKLTLALYSFDIKRLEKISCNNINLGNQKCGSKTTKEAYYINVSDLNNRYYELFNEDVDYSLLDTDNLILGNCTNKNNNAYNYKYNEKESKFISIYTNSICKALNLKVTKVTKSQNKDILSLDIDYNNGKMHHDRFYFKVREDGTYYFYSSIAVEE